MRFLYGSGSKRDRAAQPQTVVYPVSITSGTVDVADLRRNGKVVVLDLMLTGVPATNTWSAIGAIPDELAPKTDVRAVANGSAYCWIRVAPSGQILVFAQPSATLAMGVSLTWILP